MGHWTTSHWTTSDLKTMVTPFKLVLISTAVVYASRKYDISVKVTSDLCACFPGSNSPMAMRICSGSECSDFLSIPDGMPKGGKTYSFEITTASDIGTIDKVQIVNKGKNALCLDEVHVDGVEWDWSNWWFTPVGETKCFEASNSNGCSTMTITGAKEELWNAKNTNPCEFAAILDKPTTSSCDGINAETGIAFTFWERLKCECTNKISIGVILGIVLFAVVIGCILYWGKRRNGCKKDEENQDYNLMQDDDENSVEMSQISVHQK